MMNGNGIGEVVLSSSTIQLIHTLSHAFDKLITNVDDEIILTNIGHEANYAHERVNLDDLSALLSERTRIIAIPYVSNLIGEILDIESIVKLVRQKCPCARVIVDGVAYASHRAIDVYSSHIAVLYGSNVAWQELVDISAISNHFFIPQSDISYQYELGCLNHEACARILGVKSYFE
ncbi:unnamed protein product [Rotaria sp. Silwood1]|nr:unnamed protein product [Rotaria sp. Silwood1]